MLKALVIDDESGARADLCLALSAHAAELAVVGEAETLDQAEALLASADYNLVFLDVQLRGGTGFGLVPHVSADARIVFVTAYNEHALRAFEVNALDYLLKPISPDRLARAVQRSRTALAGLAAVHPDSTAIDPGAADTPLRPNDSIYLRHGLGGLFVRLRDVSAIEAAENYSTTHLVNGSQFLLRRTMKTWEDILPPTHFMRVHRTAIVNLERITRYERDRGEHTLLFLDGVKEPLTASRKLWPELQARLERLRLPT
jgi:two-component system LytT family response regulator